MATITETHYMEKPTPELELTSLEREMYKKDAVLAAEAESNHSDDRPPSYTSVDKYPHDETSNGLSRMRGKCTGFCGSHASIIGKIILGILFVGYTVYLGFAIRYNVEYAKALIVLTGLTIFFLVYNFIRDRWGDTIYRKVLRPPEMAVRNNWHCLQWFVYPALIIGVVLYLALDVIKEVRQLQSLSGIVLFIFLEYIFSKHPDKVNWRPVIWGFALQLIFAIIVLRWQDGYNGIKWLSDQVTIFVEYGYEGAASVFGDPFLVFHPFVFMAMPLLIYIGAVMGILYYLGIIQVAASKMGWCMQASMGTTAIESLGVAGNIFLNGMDIMLMLRQYLDKLTKSEFHCFLVGNHATVAGFAFAIFVLFGAPPQHLLSAAVMSAPATIAISKLNYPETEESKTKDQKDIKLGKGEESNMVEAGANGAAVAGQTAMTVVVNFIAFLSMLAFVNATLSWLGGRVGYPQLSFEIICSYLFWPLALVIGVEVQYCREVAKLLGIKVFTSEIIAYQELGVSIQGPLADSPRSATIATYALCGFSGLSTLAIAVGVWNTVCPSKVKDMTQQMWRAIINANISCFLTACVAGLMYNQEVMGDPPQPSPIGDLIDTIFEIIPSYKDLFALLE